MLQYYFLGTLKVTFQPGQSLANICVAINDDDIKEQSKRFRLKYFNIDISRGRNGSI